MEALASSAFIIYPEGQAIDPGGGIQSDAGVRAYKFAKKVPAAAEVETGTVWGETPDQGWNTINQPYRAA
jgi:hypothetical protein